MVNSVDVKNDLYDDAKLRTTSRSDSKKHADKEENRVDDAFSNIRGKETYIPFRPVVLRERLILEYLANDTDNAAKFRELCRWVSLRNGARLQIENGDAFEKYAHLDPDSQVTDREAQEAEEREMRRHEEALAKAVSFKLQLNNKVTPHEDAGGKGHMDGATSVMARTDGAPASDVAVFQERLDNFSSELSDLLAKSSFSPLSKDQMRLAESLKSRHGLDVSPPLEDVLETRFWFRGLYRREYTRRRWIFFRQTASELVLTRLILSFRLLVPASEDDVAVDVDRAKDADRKGKSASSHRSWVHKLATLSHKQDLELLRDDFLYLRLYKDIPAADIDMLLPGAVAKFSFMDHFFVWFPLLFGVGSAIHELVKANFNFTSLTNSLVAIFMIVTPLIVSWRAYNNLRHRAQEYQDEINNLFLLRNLSSNSGVISQMISDAQEQEDNEAMLAYLFLWRGLPSPSPMSLKDLDSTAEQFISRRRRLLQAASAQNPTSGGSKKEGKGRKGNNVASPEAPVDEADVSFNFEVSDAVRKLHLLGLLKNAGVKGQQQRGNAPPGAAAGGGVNGNPLDDGSDNLDFSSPDQLVQVLPIDEAVKAAHLRMFSESEELFAVASRNGNGGAYPGARAEAPVFWKECVEVYKPTGQPFRYFFNTATGQSQYEPPSEPYTRLPPTVTSAVAGPSVPFPPLPAVPPPPAAIAPSPPAPVAVPNYSNYNYNINNNNNNNNSNRPMVPSVSGGGGQVIQGGNRAPTSPPLPQGTPPLPAGMPPLPAGTPPLPAGTPPLPAGTPPLPTGERTRPQNPYSSTRPAVPAPPPLPSAPPPLPSAPPPLPSAPPPLPSAPPPLPSAPQPFPSAPNNNKGTQQSPQFPSSSSSSPSPITPLPSSAPPLPLSPPPLPSSGPPPQFPAAIAPPRGALQPLSQRPQRPLAPISMPSLPPPLPTKK